MAVMAKEGILPDFCRKLEREYGWCRWRNGKRVVTLSFTCLDDIVNFGEGCMMVTRFMMS